MSQGKVKGSIVLQTVKYIRSFKERGRALVPKHLEHYLRERILPTKWYPEEDHLALQHVSTELYLGPEAVDDLEAWEKLSRDSSGQHFTGTYRSLVRKGDPTRTLAGYGGLWKLRHDTGEIQVENKGPNEAIIRLKGYALVSAKQCASIQGSLACLLDHAGASSIVVSHPRCTANGDAVCEWHLRWSQPA